jgi:uroporphyrinogen-III decarboxylase
MTSRERMLTALANGRPDRLPCQVHDWMPSYLARCLGDIDAWEAYARFGMDHAIYLTPDYRWSDHDLARWRVVRRDKGVDDSGNRRWEETIVTPKGTLHRAGVDTPFTSWDTEYLLKSERDIELWLEFEPVPVGVDVSAIRAARERLGDKGIIRTRPFSPGQGSPWQSFCTKYGTEQAILLACDEPDYVHHVLEHVLRKTLRVTAMWEGIAADLIEVGGGAGSSTVISPAMFRAFCLPYEHRQNEAFHEVGLKVVLHLCGGVMPLLDLVVETGADGLETMTPPSMGGDCDLREASRRVGGRLFFVGGFDQHAGFEEGTPERVRQLVLECFEATRDHAGYICSPSDHFFRGDPANIQAFADAARECRY